MKNVVAAETVKSSLSREYGRFPCHSFPYRTYRRAGNPVHYILTLCEVGLVILFLLPSKSRRGRALRGLSHTGYSVAAAGVVESSLSREYGRFPCPFSTILIAGLVVSCPLHLTGSPLTEEHRPGMVIITRLCGQGMCPAPPFYSQSLWREPC
jgi:hypothetical protein